MNKSWLLSVRARKEHAFEVWKGHAVTNCGSLSRPRKTQALEAFVVLFFWGSLGRGKRAAKNVAYLSNQHQKGRFGEGPSHKNRRRCLPSVRSQIVQVGADRLDTWSFQDSGPLKMVLLSASD